MGKVPVVTTAPATAAPQQVAAVPAAVKLLLRISSGILLGLTLFYVLLLGLGSIPYFQRQFVYAHKLHTAYFADITQPELWGFAKNQVRPFVHRPRPGDAIFGWHVLPYNQYVDARAEMWDQDNDLDTHSESAAFMELGNPKTKLVLYFHGNAGHVAQSHRPNFYRVVAGIPDCHIIAIDYRGFGLSRMEGSPNETSLIEDGVEMVQWAIEEAKIPPSRIVIAGHSLGTAAAGGVFSHYAQTGIDFAGVVLVSGFSHLTTMLTEYRIGGMIPVFGPIGYSRTLTSLFGQFVVDEWHTKLRVHDAVKAARHARLAILHGARDRDIPPSESQKLFEAAISGMETHEDEDVDYKDGSFVRQRTQGSVRVRFETVPHAGHDNIIGFPNVAMAIDRCFRG